MTLNISFLPSIYLPGFTSFTLSNAGFGWFIEAELHILHLIVSCALDRNPNLKLINDHVSEMLPMMLQHVDTMFGTGVSLGSN